jgi:hypothetical protein
VVAREAVANGLQRRFQGMPSWRGGEN